MSQSHEPTTNFDLWTFASSTHPKTVFHQPLRCSLRLQVHAEWVNVAVHACGFVQQSVPSQQGGGSESFSHGMYQALSSPHFEKRAWGQDWDTAGYMLTPSQKIKTLGGGKGGRGGLEIGKLQNWYW